MRAVGNDTDLPTGERTGIDAPPSQLHRQKRNGDSLSGREQHVQFAVIRNGGHLMRQLEQTVGLTAHGREHDDCTVPCPLCLRHAVGDTVDPLDGSHRRTAIFLDDQGHRRQLFEKNLLTNFVASRGGIFVASASASVKRRSPASPIFSLPSPNA